jgi:hypothetical protein
MALDALVIVAPSLGALVLAGPLNGNKALLLATPCAVALNVAFIAIGAPRTLVDRLSGVHILQDPSQEAAGGSGASMVDGLLLLAIGLPVALVFDWRDYGAAAVGSGTVTALVLALDIMVWATTGASIGSRAVRSRGAVLSS